MGRIAEPAGKEVGHLPLEAPGEQAVQVVVAVVDEDEAPVLHVAAEVLLLPGVEPHQGVPGHVEEGKGEDLGGVQRHHLLPRVDLGAGVLDHRVEEVGRHLRVDVPVARAVAHPGEGEAAGAGRGRRAPGRRREPTAAMPAAA